ncbi:MAG: peptide-methionine (S)-S-oxide reductase, partial [Halieaceae bacterium]
MSLFDIRKKRALPSGNEALPGRSTPLAVAERHYVLDAPL